MYPIFLNRANIEMKQSVYSSLFDAVFFLSMTVLNGTSLDLFIYRRPCCCCVLSRHDCPEKASIFCLHTARFVTDEEGGGDTDRQTKGHTMMDQTEGETETEEKEKQTGSGR